MLASYVDPSVHQLRVGQVVAYDYLHAAKTWQWTLGTVREIKDYTAVVQQWGLHTGDIDTLRSILLKEVDTENGRMKNYHDMLGVAREKLASIRRSNEDRVSHVRGHFDKAREKVELIDEVDLRKVTAQAAPSPVAVAVLKAVWAVAKCDPTAVEFYEWADVQLEYRKTAALDEIAKTDVLTKPYPSAESLQQSLEQDPKLNYKAAARNSPVVASLHAWVTTALAYQQAYNLLAHDKRIQEQNDAIAAAIAGMKACRAKIAKLKDELSSKDAAALPGQVTSFTRTSVLVTIPLSAVISPVNVDSDVKRCVLTKDEVEQIPVDAKITRYTQNQKLAITASHLLHQYAAATSTRIYATELEDRLFFFQHYMASALRDAQAGAVQANQRLAHSLHELEAFRQKRHDAKKARAAEPELADADGVEPSSGPTSSRSPAGRAAPRGQSAAPRGTASQQHMLLDPAYQPIDPTTIANEPVYAVTIEEFKAKDAAGERAMDEAERMADEVQRLAVELEGAKAEADKLAEELAAKDEELAAHRQKRHDAQQARASDPALAAADAVAPRSGKGAALPHVGAVQRQAVDPATVPVAPAVIAEEPLYVATAEELQHVRDFADQLAEELEAFRQKRHDAKKARAAEPELADADGVEPSSGPTSSRSPAGRAAPRGQSAAPRGTASQQHMLLDPAYQPIDPTTIANEPVYAVTIEEFKAKDAAGERAMDEAERMADEVQRLAVELEGAKAEADKLAEELAAKDEELAAHRQKRHDAQQARASDPALAAADAVAPRSGKGAALPHVGAVQRQAVDPATVPVAPAVIAEEPLYVATAEELQHVRDFADQLAEELEAFRQKRHDAKKARAAEPELADADGVEPSSGPTSSRSPAGRAAPRGQSAAPRGTASQQHMLLDPAYQPIDPTTIANEPVYAVTIEEFKAKDAAGERAMDEAERMADEVQRLAVELEGAKAEADKLAEELAAKDEELAAHRQKRHDAQQARASDPALAAADAVAPRSGKGAALPHVGAVQRQAVDPATVPVAPAVIAEEPLYVATAEELQHVRDFADQLAEELEAFRQKRHDAKKARAAEPELADADGVEPSSGPTSSRSPAGRAAPRGQSAAPRGTASQQHMLLDPAYQPIDPTTIANEPVYAVTIEEFKAKDAAGERAMDEAERMADEVQRLAVELEGAKAEADKLAEELAAKDEELAAHRQKRHDAQQARASDPALAAADAVAPRSGKGAALPHVGAVQRQAVDPATVPVAPAVIAEEPLYVATAEELQHVRDFADQLAEELEAFRQKRHDAKKARAAEPELADADGVEPSSGPTSSRSPAGRAAPRGQSAAPRGTASQQHMLLDPAYQPIDPTTIANEPVYAVTIEEFKAKDAAGERAMDEAERMADEVQRLAVELEGAKAEADKLAEELAAKDEELAAHRQKRHDAQQARASDPALAAADAVAPRSGKGAALPHVGAVQRQAVDPATVPVAPAVIAEEPLYVATAEELQHVRDFADQLAEELEAFRQKRHDAKKARAAEPELADADGVEPSSGPTSSRSPAGRAAPRGQSAAPRGTASQQHMLLDPAYQPIDPTTIANEPVYAVTIEEFKAKDAAGERAMDEAERMADEVQRLAVELEGAKAEADKLAEELAAKDEELAAHRQKRHDAQQARASDPALAAADAVAPRSGKGAALPHVGAVQRQAVDPATVPVAPAVIAEEPLYVATAEELQHVRDFADQLAEELEAFRQKRHDAKKARAAEPELADADGVEPSSGPTSSRSPAGRAAPRGQSAAPRGTASQQHMLLDPAYQPIDPTTIANEPVYAVTIEEFKAKDAAGERAMDEAERMADEVQRLAVELEGAKAEADKLAEELQHVRGVADEAAHHAPAREAEVADALENLRSELDEAREKNAKLEDEVCGLKEQLSDALDAYKKVAVTLEVAEDERHQLCDDLEAALDELELKKDEYDELLGNLEEVQGLLEAADVAGRTAVEALEQRSRDMADLQSELANALDASKENENLRALLDAKEREINRLKEFNSFWTDPVPTGKQKVTHRLTKIFDGDWTRLMRNRPEALKAAFVIDSSNACHVPGDQIVQVDFDHD